MGNSEQPSRPVHPAVMNRRGSKALTRQTCYTEVNVAPSLDTPFSDPGYHAIEVLSDGKVEIVDGKSNAVEMELVKNRIYPVAVQEIKSGGTQVPQSEIYLYGAA